MTNIVGTSEVQSLLDRASGLDQENGDPRLKAITRDVLEALMAIIEKHDITESEFWDATKFLQDGASEFGLILPGVGIEHFIDLHLDAKDAEAGISGGTPRTIEGPLYVAGAPLVDGDLTRTNDVNLTTDPDDTDTLTMSGRITGPDGEPVSNAILHVWHANSKGFYSHFDPTGAQSPFNNRRRIKLGSDGRYAFSSKMPRGYSCPPGGDRNGCTQRHGRRGRGHPGWRGRKYEPRALCSRQGGERVFTWTGARGYNDRLALRQPGDGGALRDGPDAADRPKSRG